MPFCSTDEQTGELTGALSDYLAHAQNKLNSSKLTFKTIPYDTTEDALAALDAGQIDCVFPIFLSSYDAEQRGIMLTDPAMETELNAIMRISDRQELSTESTITFAVNENMLNIESFIMEYYPNAERKPFQGPQACYKAVASGEADCFLISNYRLLTEEETLRENQALHRSDGRSAFAFLRYKKKRSGALFHY